MKSPSAPWTWVTSASLSSCQGFCYFLYQGTPQIASSGALCCQLLRRLCCLLRAAACFEQERGFFDRSDLRHSRLIGIVRSFNGPASRSILPQLVPEEHFANAVAWNATIFQAATILGPSFGGIVYAAFRRPSAVYVIAMLTAIGATISTFRIKPEVKARPRNR